MGINLYNLENDGIDHINIYSKAKTQLGRFLSNFYHYYQETPYGQFASIEGYWYYLLIPKYDLRGNQLKDLHGFLAKKIGKELLKGKSDWEESEGFKDLIKRSITDKILSSDYYNEFVESTLPFTHYYCYSGKIIEVSKANWIIQYIEGLRASFKIDKSLEHLHKI